VASRLVTPPDRSSLHLRLETVLAAAWPRVALASSLLSVGTMSIRPRLVIGALSLVALGGCAVQGEEDAGTVGDGKADAHAPTQPSHPSKIQTLVATVSPDGLTMLAPGSEERAAASQTVWQKTRASGVMPVAVVLLLVGVAGIVFAVVGEEFGIILCLIIVALFALLVMRGLTQALRRNSAFERMAVAGLTTQLGVQAFGGEQRTLYREMSAYWARFASDLDPNGGTSSTWPIYDSTGDHHLILDTTIAEGTAADADVCALWDGA